MNREKGHPVQATVTCIRGTCNAGHRVGDVLPVSARNTAGMCGYLYHAAHPAILMLQFGGAVPWGPADRVVLNCPDPVNLLTVELRRLPEGVPGEAPAAEAAPASAEAAPVRLGRVVCRVEG
ncbi:hypothetical protein M446_0096 [Methylobacterium sp. 4-46]|uniref:TIGR04076 family protein n=1 Tax=unclassified Methylobacterium TaxID=2615210 RepID=UPI000152DB43|nr:MULTISPECIES: TIGR04076 family protein [Methylobacterium]ACA14681.1 hypothetical protein M446_0096 [Methylobacterium sp. 4-46]WFT80434.1 TIGR04076 family protein [Methylobacterium nodulans]